MIYTVNEGKGMKSSHQKSFLENFTTHMCQALGSKTNLARNWDREKAAALAKDAAKHSVQDIMKN